MKFVLTLFIGMMLLSSCKGGALETQAQPATESDSAETIYLKIKAKIKEMHDEKAKPTKAQTDADLQEIGDAVKILVKKYPQSEYVSKTIAEVKKDLEYIRAQTKKYEESLKCETLSFFNVLKKLDGSSYEISRQIGFQSAGCGGRLSCVNPPQVPLYEHAILKTTATVFESTGRVQKINVTKAGKIKVSLENGFQKEVEVYEEALGCKGWWVNGKKLNFKENKL